MKLFTPFKVGLLTLAGIAALVVVIANVKGGADSREGVRVYAEFDDATGLVKQSRVQIAGITVGEIQDIELNAGRARVWVFVTEPLYSDAAVMRRTASLLGDTYLQLYPGNKPPALKDGDPIPQVKYEAAPADLIQELKAVSEDIRQITGSFREVLGGDQGRQALQAIVDNLNQTAAAINQSVSGNQGSITRIVDNVAVITDDIRGFTGTTGNSVGRILNEVEAIVSEVRTMVGESKGDVGASLGTLRGTMGRLQDTLGRLSEAVENMTSITGKIDEGKGTIGKLINDDHLATELDGIVTDASDFVKSLTGMQTIVGLRSEYNFGLNGVKNYVSLSFQPKEDKYYLFEVIDDPRGSTSVTKTTLDTLDPSRQPVIHETETVTTDALKFSLQFAKEYYFLTGRFGIIENTGGMGANARLLNDRLDFAVDLFDFGADRNPRVRLHASWELLKDLYLVGGFDDFLNVQVNEFGETLFLGAMLRFTDDDLKALISATPSVSF